MTERTIVAGYILGVILFFIVLLILKALNEYRTLLKETEEKVTKHGE